jgi:hypothetical protein
MGVVVRIRTRVILLKPSARRRAIAQARRHLGSLAGVCHEGSAAEDLRVIVLALRLVEMQAPIIRRLLRAIAT